MTAPMTDAEMIAKLERLWAAVQGETRGCGKDDAGDWRQPKSIEGFEHAIYKHTPRLLALAKEAHAAHAEAERLREALAPFVAATGQHDDGSVWYETARVPGSAWEQARRAALAQEQRDE